MKKPESYSDLTTFMLRWALILLVIGLAFGVYSREILRTIEKSVDDWAVLEALRNRAFLGHGHFLFLGFLIPGVLALITRRVVAADAEKRILSLTRAFRLVMIGTVLTLALSVYSSSAIIFAVAGGADPAAADHSLFGGSIMVRSILYTLAHPLMGVGLVWYAVVLMKALRHPSH